MLYTVCNMCAESNVISRLAHVTMQSTESLLLLQP